MWSNDIEKRLIISSLAQVEADNGQLSRTLIDALNAYTTAYVASLTAPDGQVQFDASTLGSAQEIKARALKTAEDTARKELAALNTIRTCIQSKVTRTINTETFMKDKVGPWIRYLKVRSIVERFSQNDLVQAKRDFYNRLLVLGLESEVPSTAAHTLITDGSLSLQAQFFAQLIASDLTRRARELMIMQPAIQQPELMGLVHELVGVREVIAGILPLEQY